MHVADLAGWIEAQGHQSQVIVGGRGAYVDELKRRGLSVHSLKHLDRPIRPFLDIRAIAELRGEFKRACPDIISLHSSKAGLIGRLAARGLGIPIIFTAHGWSFTEGVATGKAAMYRTIERLFAPMANIIITVSEFDRELALRFRVGKADQIRTIHNAMPETDVFADPGSQGTRVSIISVARLDSQKDHETLLKALAKIEKRSWKLVLVGDGPLESRLRDLSKQLGVEEHKHPTCNSGCGTPARGWGVGIRGTDWRGKLALIAYPRMRRTPSKLL